ncbi:MAG: DNA repair exonuclease [Firmicutes bacterium]|nr:DNA repair exonuclease [Bacillota bacterium]
MKIIHCADLHLDSKMDTHLSKEQARERKAEILNTFNRMVSYAAENGVSAIIIAGDLFDRKTVSRTAKNTVYNAVKSNPDIEFFYLKGNHDTENALLTCGERPQNLKLFNGGWTAYSVGERVTVTGAELDKNTPPAVYKTLSLDADKINIVTLHGAQSEYASKSDAEIIPLGELKNKNIDYLALGHIHAPKIERLDSRGMYGYSGCLEGRGFDECGARGFILLDADEAMGKVSIRFVPFAARELVDIRVDVTDLENTADISDAAQRAVAAANTAPENIVKITLTGEVGVECEKNTELIKKRFEPCFYFVRVKDETKLKIDYSRFKSDRSLKGEFVRCVMAGDMTEDEKAAVIRCGIQALMGEEIE